MAARCGAWYYDDEFLTASAAAYTCEASQVTYTNTHQVTGAIGVTTEYGLVLYTMRLMGLQRELGGRRAHARRVAAARRHGQAVAQPPATPLPPVPPLKGFAVGPAGQAVADVRPGRAAPGWWSSRA